MKELPPISVVVPTFRRPLSLGWCLAGLAAQDYPRERFEIVVVDDGGGVPLDDATAEWAATGQLRLVVQSHAGPAMARNRGVELCSHDLIAFTDDDCVPRPGWLRALAQRLLEVPTALVGGRTANGLPNNRFARATQNLIDYLHEQHDSNGAGQAFFTSNNIALSRTLFRKVGGFDAGMPLAAAEDRDLCHRWLAAGHPLVQEHEALVDHVHDLTLSGFVRQHFQYGRGAYHYRLARLREGEAGSGARPLRFYRDIVGRPLRYGHGASALVDAGLLALSQAATAVGYTYEMLTGKKGREHRISRRRPGARSAVL